MKSQLCDVVSLLLICEQVFRKGLRILVDDVDAGAGGRVGVVGWNDHIGAAFNSQQQKTQFNPT